MLAKACLTITGQGHPQVSFSLVGLVFHPFSTPAPNLSVPRLVWLL